MYLPPSRAVKPWSSFQCTGIHHAVWAWTYKGDEHLAYALNKSIAFTFLPNVFMIYISFAVSLMSLIVYAYIELAFIAERKILNVDCFIL